MERDCQETQVILIDIGGVVSAEAQVLTQAALLLLQFTMAYAEAQVLTRATDHPTTLTQH